MSTRRASTETAAERDGVVLRFMLTRPMLSGRVQETGTAIWNFMRVLGGEHVTRSISQGSPGWINWATPPGFGPCVAGASEDGSLSFHASQPIPLTRRARPRAALVSLTRRRRRTV